MARVIPSKALWQAAATAENLTATQAKLAAAAAQPIMGAMQNWLTDPAQLGGADEAMFRAAWTELAGLTDPQLRAVMRTLAALSDATFLP